MYAIQAHPSMHWVGLSVCLLILAAGLIGMMTKQLKQIKAEDGPHIAKIRAYSWLTALIIIGAGTKGWFFTFFPVPNQ